MKTNFEIQEELTNVHPNLIWLEDYKGANKKILAKCTNCGLEWQVIPRSLISSKLGCKQCGLENKHRQNFINWVSQELSDSYEYIDYKSSTDATIKCKKCGHVRNTTVENLKRYGCKPCKLKLHGDKTRSNTNEFIEKAIKIHGDRYDYSKVDYINCKTPIIIICKKHGDFLQTPNKHLQGHNCKKCHETRGEELTRLFLTNNNIAFEQEKICYIPDKIRLDFYICINDQIHIIEINGLQHYEPVEYFGGEQRFKKQVIRDKLLQEWCIANNIHLHIIKYDENINEKLTKIYCRLIK